LDKRVGFIPPNFI